MNVYFLANISMLSLFFACSCSKILNSTEVGYLVDYFNKSSSEIKNDPDEFLSNLKGVLNKNSTLDTVPYSLVMTGPSTSHTAHLMCNNCLIKSPKGEFRIKLNILQDVKEIYMKIPYENSCSNSSFKYKAISYEYGQTSMYDTITGIIQIGNATKVRSNQNIRQIIFYKSSKESEICSGIPVLSSKKL